MTTAAHVTPEQTMATWFARVGFNRHAMVCDVFPDDDRDKAHRANCCILVRRGWLHPDMDGGVPPSLRELDPALRYYPSAPALHVEGARHEQTGPRPPVAQGECD